MSPAPFNLLRSLARLAAASVMAHYRLPKLGGWIHLCASILDPFLYAIAAYAILHVAFDAGGQDRFWLIALGIAALRWTISSLLAADEMTALYRWFRAYGRGAALAALVVALSPAWVAFMASAAIIYGASFFLFGYLNASDILGFSGGLVLALCAHAGANALALLLVAWTRLKGYISSATPAVGAALFVGLLSPILYGFSDLRFDPGGFMTSLNPFSHVLAAYHGLFLGASPSLEVLPAALPLIIAALWAMNRLCKRQSHAPLPPHIATLGPGFHLWIIAQPPDKSTQLDHLIEDSSWANFSGIGFGHLSLTARDLVFLCALFQDLDWKEAQSATRKLRAASDLKDLFEQDVRLHPAWAQAQLALSLALMARRRNLILRGHIEAIPLAKLGAAWTMIEESLTRYERILFVTEGWSPLITLSTGQLRLFGGSAGHEEKAVMAMPLASERVLLEISQ